ncbi:hypothetical protein MKUB_55840 [Mycobacterium kubicae]|uniref:Major capsid protein n=1 Tax=Mycobacterium kubicae TaxID=120959 RepID=A0AAX1J3U3_9MYCO|nr:hypothetical protein [Mycobacterium kubicae]MCV7094099.1 hypothetical protein [Mycobacterium kubicae]ORV98445.1 hypothetical protein AWC13_13405 [Mycobacterium kubicae]QNI12541.1 hypothetical protein GAN18_16150 [Mycobacterium kubicae]QPI36066.1 hypothetical protein I2456_15945 [Mycobacterium kubicae]GFG68094.1 hypothetical protein MKUB_55840 [Mycobacterium kubicae]
MTMPPVTTYTTPLPVDFVVPPVNPTAFGLYAATTWTEMAADEPSRHLHGVEVRGTNYPNGQASGIWDAPWCGDPAPGSLKTGERQGILDPFEPVTVWAYDECDLTEPSRRQIEENAAQIFRLEEQPMVERAFADRLKLDAADLGDPQTAASLAQAVGYLEGAMALTGTTGYFHIGAQWVALGGAERLFTRSGTRWVSPLGNVWIIGGGYVEGLGDQIIATSQPFGWRDQVQVRTAIDERHNIYAAIAERSVLVSYEACIAAVTITPPEPTP